MTWTTGLADVQHRPVACRRRPGPADRAVEIGRPDDLAPRIQPLLEADARWYTTRAPGVPGSETHWRDPWVVRDDTGLWHAYVTAHVDGGARAEVISLVELEGRWAPVDLSRAVRVTSEDLCVGKVVPLRDGGHRFLAFENRDGAGLFSGGVIDPCEVAWNDAGAGLQLVGDLPSRWLP